MTTARIDARFAELKAQGRAAFVTYTMAGGSRSYTDPEMFRNGEKVSEKGYLTDVMTREALGFLDQQTPGKPFFLSIGYLNPHTPYAGHPQKYYDMYAGANFDTFGWQPAAPNALREKELLKDTVGNIRKCAASVTALDDQIPLLLNKLSEKALARFRRARPGSSAAVSTCDLASWAASSARRWARRPSRTRSRWRRRVRRVPVSLGWARHSM